MIARELAELLVYACRNVACNCLPYSVMADRPIHLPREFSFFDPSGDLNLEMERLGARIGGVGPYDVIFLKEDRIVTKEDLVSSGKLCVLTPKHDRDRYLRHWVERGFTLIDQRLIENNLLISFRRARNFSRPLWNGEKNARILLHSSGGFGDDIACARHHQIFRPGTIYLESRAEIKPLFEKTLSYNLVFSKGESPPNYDFHFPVESLSALYDSHSIRFPYLKLPKTNVLGEGIKVGFCYRGHHVKYSTVRSFDPTPLIETLSGRAKIYCFQKYSEYDFDVIAPQGSVGVASGIRNWLDTAVLMSEMDYFVSPDTSLFHLAAAMGIRTYVAMDTEAGQYFSPYCDRCQYYPDVRVFWGWEAVERIGHEIARQLISI
jgi:hypothetical protein